MNKLTILGVDIEKTTSDGAAQAIISRVIHKQKTFVATINPEFIVQAQADPQYKQVLNNADIAVADGIGVLWAASAYNYQLKSPLKALQYLEAAVVGVGLGLLTMVNQHNQYAVLPERVTGVDLSDKIAQHCANHQLSLFLLGGQEGIAEKAAAKLIQKYPELIISGTYSGDGSSNGDADTTSQLQAHPSDIVLVAYGAPKQEYWITRNLPSIPQSAAMGVGGTFMYISGASKRAPAVFRKIGLEWLYRLISEPWRWKRQMALPKFFIMVILDMVRRENNISADVV